MFDKIRKAADAETAKTLPAPLTLTPAQIAEVAAGTAVHVTPAIGGTKGGIRISS